MLIIRLNKELTDHQIESLAVEFPEMLVAGSTIKRTAALPEEVDEPDTLNLPRIIIELSITIMAC